MLSMFSVQDQDQIPTYLFLVCFSYTQPSSRIHHSCSVSGGLKSRSWEAAVVVARVGLGVGAAWRLAERLWAGWRGTGGSADRWWRRRRT